jgi:hypothetical protein
MRIAFEMLQRRRIKSSGIHIHIVRCENFLRWAPIDGTIARSIGSGHSFAAHKMSNATLAAPPPHLDDQALHRRGLRAKFKGQEKEFAR